MHNNMNHFSVKSHLYTKMTVTEAKNDDDWSKNGSDWSKKWQWLKQKNDGDWNKKWQWLKQKMRMTEADI